MKTPILTLIVLCYKLSVERIAETFRRLKLLKTLEPLQPQSLVEVGSGLNFIFVNCDEKVIDTIVRVPKSSQG